MPVQQSQRGRIQRLGGITQPNPANEIGRARRAAGDACVMIDHGLWQHRHPRTGSNQAQCQSH